MSGSDSRLIRIFQPKPDAALNLICIAHAGGGASNFLGWSQALGPEIQVLAVQPPGREERHREPQREQLSHLVSDIVHALQPWLAKPFAVFGHSLGALIGYELLAALRDTDAPLPLAFCASACRAPHLAAVEQPMHDLPDPEFFRELQTRYDGIPAALVCDPEYMRALLTSVRADIRLFEDYLHVDRLPLSCPILAIGGKLDLNVTQPTLQAWKNYTCGDFRLELLPAGHFYLKTHRAQVTDLVRGLLIPLVLSVKS